MIFSNDNKTLISCEKTASGRILIPEGVITIKSNAFQDCTNISEIVIPDSLCRIESGAFKNCQSLCRVNLVDSITEIGSQAFCGCCSLVKIDIPHSLYGIYESTFYKCKSLTNIRIPENIHVIRRNAFGECVNLERVTIESSAISISPMAFIGCNVLSHLYLKNFNPNIAISSFSDCPNLNVISPWNDAYSLTETISLKEVYKQLSKDLKFSSLYYRLMGMNITQMKWSQSLKNEKSFKEPIDSNWETFKNQEQSLEYVMGLDWDNSAGIGLVLGYNKYRAIDVDIDGDFQLRCLYPNKGVNGLIDDFLNSLNLPLDYPWVIRSGSGYGFHIVFRCDDIEVMQVLDSISFEPNNRYNDGVGNSFFRRIELRWCDHLVLPPSVHASGLQYYFRNNKYPISSPSFLSLSQIDDLLYKFCGDRVFICANYKGREFKLTRIEKIVSRHDSYLTPHEHNKDDAGWLEHTNNEESVNNLAIRYLFGEDVLADARTAVKLFYSKLSQSSCFNLLNLYACGFLKYNHARYTQLYNKLDKEMFEDYLYLIEDNANKYINKTDLYLFFDTETTGLPKKYDAPASNVDNWPRLIQLSWIICDENKNIISKENHIIKPMDFVIPVASTAVHGITNKCARDNGEYLIDVLDLFFEDLRKVKYIVGHNVDFDKSVIEAESIRVNKVFSWEHYISLCTMKSTLDFCKIPNTKFGYQYPKLQDLYSKLFGSTFEDVHNSFSDVSATFKCFWELRNMGWTNNDFMKDIK